MKIVISADTPPPESMWPFYVCSIERGLDPWHKDAFPDECKHAVKGGERSGGWYLLDHWENAVGWIPDGYAIEVKPTETDSSTPAESTLPPESEIN